MDLSACRAGYERLGDSEECTDPSQSKEGALDK